MLDLADHPHRRYNPLTGEWVLVSPHRTKRPWQGQVEKLPPDSRPSYDPKCYLCPGNQRAGGHRNPPYATTFVFDNDFAALLDLPAAEGYRQGDLLLAEPERGICRVVCFSPRHDLTVAEMELDGLRGVVECWAEQSIELNALPWMGYVQIFENRGEMMGCSNPHPHCQIWASANVPHVVDLESQSQREHFERHGRTLLSEYLDIELRRAERLVAANEHFVALVPFWAVWPFEIMIVSRRPAGRVEDLSDDERLAFSAILKTVTTRYDNLFETSFPYSFGIHQRPTRGGEGWHLHAHFYPPLLRSATVRKFLVGYEMLATPQRDITPEAAAQRLRDLPDIHYKTVSQ